MIILSLFFFNMCLWVETYSLFFFDYDSMMFFFDYNITVEHKLSIWITIKLCERKTNCAIWISIKLCYSTINQ